LANKQPFYHRATILFTATRDVSREELQRMVQRGANASDGALEVIAESIEVEECDSEPGDPADLVE
jgi:hypothetical protein